MSGEIVKERFDEKYLQSHLLAVVNSLNLSNPKFSIKLASAKGDNYVSVVYRVTVIEEKNDGDKVFSFIVKCLPNTGIIQRQIQYSIFFKREVFIYETVIAAFAQFLREHNEVLNFIPKCYRTDIKRNEETVILEDLSACGFLLRDRLKQLDYPHASLAMRALGRYHAISFALRDQKPEVFRELAAIEENLFTDDMVTQHQFIARADSLADNVKTVLNDEDPKYLERFNISYEDLWLNVKKLLFSKDAAEPYAVICHGDYWMNNFLFKYDEDSGEPVDIQLIDFQLARYSSPATDILYIIYTSCGQDLRTCHYDDLIRDYHASLSDYLTKLGSDPKRLFPFDALKEHLEKFGAFGAAIIIIVIHMFTHSKENVPDIGNGANDDVSVAKKRIHTDQFYRATLKNAFKDIIDRNYV